MGLLKKATADLLRQTEKLRQLQEKTLYVLLHRDAVIDAQLNENGQS
jgi:hypothetical protein